MDRYTLQLAHPFHDLTRMIVGREVHMGDSCVFLSEVDLDAVEKIRALSTPGRRPSYTAFVAKAVAQALSEFPYANRRLARRWLPFLKSRIQQFTAGDVAVAVEREVPGTNVATFVGILRDADRETLASLTQRLRDLSASDESSNALWRDYKSLATRLPAWLSSLIVGLPVYFPQLWSKWRGGSVLISSPSKYGVDAVIGAWPTPLGVSFGLVKDRAVVRNGCVVIRPTFTLTLNFDRRVMAGAPAARFFKRIVDLLENAGMEMFENEPAVPAGVAGTPSQVRQLKFA